MLVEDISRGYRSQKTCTFLINQNKKSKCDYHVTEVTSRYQGKKFNTRLNSVSYNAFYR